MLQLIACDLDGTLLDSQKRIPQVNRVAIAAARERGIQFVLCSARPPRSLLPFWRDLGLHEPLVAYNGALTWDQVQQRTLAEAPMAPETVSAVIGAVRRVLHDSTLTVEAGDRWWTDRLDDSWWKAVQSVVRQPPVEEGPVEKTTAGRPGHKILFFADEARWPNLLASLPPAVRALRTRGGLVEIQASEASKAAAVARLASADQVLALGDDVNDVDLLTWAGDSAAPFGAAAEAVTAAKRTVATCDQGAVADALRNMRLETCPE